jgi:hypothetical protein
MIFSFLAFLEDFVAPLKVDLVQIYSHKAPLPGILS